MHLPAPAGPLTCCWIFPSSVTTQWVVAAAGRVPETSSEHRPRAQPEKTHARPSPPRPDAPAAAIFPNPGLPAPPGTGTAPAAILGGGGPSGRSLARRGGAASLRGRCWDRPRGGPGRSTRKPGGPRWLPQTAPAARPALRQPLGEGGRSCRARARPPCCGRCVSAAPQAPTPARGAESGSLSASGGHRYRQSRCPEHKADFKRQQAAGGAARNAFIKAR